MMRVPFPVAGHGPIDGLGRALADIDHAGDLAARPRRTATVRTAAVGFAAPDRGGALGAQAALALYEHSLVDRLVTHLQLLASGMVTFRPARDPPG